MQFVGRQLVARLRDQVRLSAAFYESSMVMPA
jgi:hypothetical protein